MKETSPTHHRRQRVAVSVLAATALALGGAACSDDDGDIDDIDNPVDGVDDQVDEGLDELESDLDDIVDTLSD